MARQRQQKVGASRKGTRFAALILLVLSATSSCTQGSKTNRGAVPPESFLLERQIGWFDGPCLAIDNSNLTRDTPVELVVMGEPQKVQLAQLDGQTHSPTACPALRDGRRVQNALAGTFFYVLKAAYLDAADIGIGIVAKPKKTAIVAGLAQIDLDDQHHNQVFSSCATGEGIKFAVWSEKAYQGQPLWSKYYYLNYDLEPNCP